MIIYHNPIAGEGAGAGSGAGAGACGVCEKIIIIMIIFITIIFMIIIKIMCPKKANVYMLLFANMCVLLQPFCK